jgi:hypothetical protein
VRQPTHGVAYSHVWVPKERGTGRKYDIPDASSVFEDGDAYVQALEAGREMLVAERPVLFFPLLVTSTYSSRQAR